MIRGAFASEGKMEMVDETYAVHGGVWLYAPPIYCMPLRALLIPVKGT